MNTEKCIFTVVGLGYVGLSSAAVLSQTNKVYIVDTDSAKLKNIINRISPISDPEMKYFLTETQLNLCIPESEEEAFKESDFTILAIPTNLNEQTGKFDMKDMDDIIERVFSLNPHTTIIIKSTTPIGYSKCQYVKHQFKNLIFSPEFIRNDKTLYDSMNPSRIILGIDCKNVNLKNAAITFFTITWNAIGRKDINNFIMEFDEAESVKLFSNAYLAMRVSFFNELDTYAEYRNIDPKRIIDGVCADSRIGTHYSNPSFGYGGYCLPKDIQQLKAEFNSIPSNLISAIIDSNNTRKNAIVQRISLFVKNMVRDDKIRPVVGIYRLNMKKDSDDFRQSAIIDVIDMLAKENDVIIFEPNLPDKRFKIFHLVSELGSFAEMSDIIVANRVNAEIEPWKQKVYSRDLFETD